MITGHDVLGLGNPNFKAETVIKGISPGAAIGVFDSAWPGNFGDPYKKVRKILLSGKVVLFRVQIFWSYQHKPCPLPVLKKALPRWEKLAKEFPGVAFYISPSCEYDKSTPKKLVQDWIKAIKQICPSCIPVLSPMGGPVVPGVLVEHHGDKVKGAHAVSLDGQSFADCDAAKLIKDNPDAVYFMAWKERYNCSAGKENPPAPQRKNAPNVDYIKGLDALFSPCVYGELKKPQLWKTYAEDHGNGDARANKALLIIKEKAAFVEILDSNNSVIERIPYYGTYLDQGHRYYSKMYAYQIAAFARTTGSDVIKVRVNGKVYVIGSAAFRAGYYQS